MGERRDNIPQAEGRAGGVPAAAVPLAAGFSAGASACGVLSVRVVCVGVGALPLRCLRGKGNHLLDCFARARTTPLRQSRPH